VTRDRSWRALRLVLMAGWATAEAIVWPIMPDALLVPLEEPPSHVYFFLCTTDPTKLIDAIHSRCTQVKVKEVGVGDLAVLVNKVADAEGVKLSEEVADKIVQCADGSPRKALVILEQVAAVDGDEDRLAVI